MKDPLERIRDRDQVMIVEQGRPFHGRAVMHGGQWYLERIRQAPGTETRRITKENVRLCRRKGRVVFQILDQEKA